MRPTVPTPHLPGGLPAETKLNCRDLMLQNPSPPWLRPLSPASLFAATVPNTSLPRLDIGRRVERDACPGRPALRGFTCVRNCESPRASIPHALTGKAAAVQCQPGSRAAASGFWLPPTGPIKDSRLLSFIHVQRTASATAQGWTKFFNRKATPYVPFEKLPTRDASTCQAR